MQYNEFIRKIGFGNLTAFVYDQENNRYNYASGEINDDIFENIVEGTEFRIENLDDYPQVKEVIVDNFLAEIAPASNVEDDGYNEVKRIIESGEAKVGIWSEETNYGGDIYETTIYMLIL